MPSGAPRSVGEAGRLRHATKSCAHGCRYGSRASGVIGPRSRPRGATVFQPPLLPQLADSGRFRAPVDSASLRARPLPLHRARADRCPEWCGALQTVSRRGRVGRRMGDRSCGEREDAGSKAVREQVTPAQRPASCGRRVCSRISAGALLAVFAVAFAAPAATQPANATGKPTISGPPQVHETLTADTSDIADADSLGAFAY